jgi:hypothetical protein
MTVAVPVPSEASVTLVGATEQVGGKAAVPVEIEHVRATAPAKPLVEVRVRGSELPVVAPEVKLSEGTEAVNVKVGGLEVTVTATGEVTEIEPFVPVTVTLRAPLVPDVVVTVSTLVPVPPEVSVTEVGARAQVPAAVPLAVDTAQVRATVPANPFVEVSVMVEVLPVVAPATRVNVAGEGARVKLGATGGAPPDTVAAARKLATLSEPRPVASS